MSRHVEVEPPSAPKLDEDCFQDVEGSEAIDSCFNYPRTIPILQTNLQGSHFATASLRRVLEEDTETIAQIQESWIRNEET